MPKDFQDMHGKGLQAILAYPWRLRGVMVPQVNQLFPVIIANGPHLYASINLIEKRAAVKTIKQTFFNLQTFAIT